MRAGDRIPGALLDRPVTGINLAPGTLRDQLDSRTTLLVFLRQLGCTFCRETLADLRSIAERDAAFPRPLFFHLGSPTAGRALVRGVWPGLRAISDPDASFYEAFGVGRGSVLQMFGPSVWAAKRRANAKGHRNGEREGDVWRMPGAFLSRDDEVIWAHAYRHAADHPDYERIRDIAAAAG